MEGDSAEKPHDAHEFADCGHYLAEEASEDLVSVLRAFMNRT